ncbi:MAG: thermonuclease family protein [Candidatus Eremiobacterota bacterium]
MLRILVLCFAMLALGAGESPQRYWGQVSQVFDGNAFQIVFSDSVETVRLVGVRAPDSRSPEPYGPQSGQFLSRLLPQGTWVALEVEDPMRDSYGALRAYAFLQNGRMVNELMLERGLAYEDTRSPGTVYPDRISQASGRGRCRRLGVWRFNGRPPFRYSDQDGVRMVVPTSTPGFTRLLTAITVEGRVPMSDAQNLQGVPADEFDAGLLELVLREGK